MKIIQQIVPNFLGPRLPIELRQSTMVSSPNGKHVVMIGGCTKGRWFYELCGEDSPYILELSGDSKETLDWKILDQKLEHPRHNHISFCISNDMAATLNTKSIGSSRGEELGRQDRQGRPTLGSSILSPN